MSDSPDDIKFLKHGAPPPRGHGVNSHQYGGDTSVAAGHGSYDTSNAFTAPTVPGASGKSGHGTTVSTPSLDLFAENIARLIPPVEAAKKALEPIGVRPGNFYHAAKIQLKVNGVEEDAGLKGQCLQALTDLGHALGGLRDGVKQLSGQYKRVEDANEMTAKDLHDAMNGASEKFNTFIHDAGGDPALGPAGGPGAAGGQAGTGTSTGTGTGGSNQSHGSNSGNTGNSKNG
ncbi:hypothetical protein OG871_36755 [Kitasatospora sp. NBC_00374]|uniref:hypothetical protein n=1 Tax=Kitasatospora sp. NBC_00374 TaxID=2975964 RepID=UPI00324AF276